MSANVLIVEDDTNTREGLSRVLKKEGYQIILSGDGNDALKKVRRENLDLVLTDLKLPGADGLEILRETKNLRPEVAVILITAYGTIESAVEAMRKGAEDYLTKPINVGHLKHLVRKALERQVLFRENVYLRRELKKRYKLENIIGQAPKMQSIFETIVQIAPARSTVLLEGESGTGKELLASAIHYTSPRAHKPFVKVSCASLSEGVLESELFGHEKGAFTGAISQRKGRFELADEGTLFLDEVSEIPRLTQIKLLRVLQEREFERVGGNKTIKLDVRLIAATNANLKEAIERGKFREDLYYRLNVVDIVIPPLRERREDIPLLVDHFLAKYNQENNKEIRGVSRPALNALWNYNWPGNIRELENAIERAVALCRGTIIEIKDLPSGLSLEERPKSIVPVEVGMSLKEVEREIIRGTLSQVRGKRVKAAGILGIGTSTLYRKMKELGLE